MESFSIGESMEVEIKIEKEHGDSVEVLHAEEMTMNMAMALAHDATMNLAANDYFTTIRIITPTPDAIFSFSRTESTFLVCLNGKPYTEKEL